ncbi:MAG: FAD-binding protein [Myxococcales bacterium]|nr:FAD-binding protein [Myxococcales bacterium]
MADAPRCLRDDPELRAAAAVDFGDIVHEAPAYVAQPRSTEDVAEVVRFARAAGLRVAARGVGHSAGGQAQVAGGIVIRMDGLQTLHAVDPQGRWCSADAGLRWRELMAALVPRGLTPPVVTDWLDLSLGGTITAGGVGCQSFRRGLQTDAVEAMTVVTGTGAIVECSATAEPELFDAVRGGLGQYGIVTRVRMALGPAPAAATLDHLVFDDVGRLLDAAEALASDDGVDGLLAHAVPNRPAELARSLGVTEGVTALPSGVRWAYDLEVLRHDRGDEPPALLEQARALGAAASLCRRRRYRYDALVVRVPPIIERDRRAGRAPHPELAMFVPQRQARALLSEIMDGLRVEDLGGGPVLLIPLRPALVRSPFVRLPDDDGAWLLGVLRAAPSPDRVEAMTRDNLALWRRGTQHGALRYPVDALPQPSTPQGWAAHYGPGWERARAAKQRYDPDHLLAPRLGIFTPDRQQ